MSKNGWMTVEDAARRLGHYVNYIYSLVRAGKLEHKREGRRILIARGSVEERAAERGR